MLKLFRSLVRMSAFLGKEITEIMRQPRLILTLLLGPFLILLLFGVGYRNQARSLRLLFVADPQGPAAAQIREYASSLGAQLIFVGITADAAEAEKRLRRGEADAVVLTPDDIYGLLRNNQRVTFTLLHDEIDPLRVDYVRAFGQIYADEINRRVLQSATAAGQNSSTTFQEDIAVARATAAAIQKALRQNDLAQARADLVRLDWMLGMVERAAGQTLGLLEGVQSSFGGDEGARATAAIYTNWRMPAALWTRWPKSRSGWMATAPRSNSSTVRTATWRPCRASWSNSARSARPSWSAPSAATSGAPRRCNPPCPSTSHRPSSCCCSSIWP